MNRISGLLASLILVAGLAAQPAQAGLLLDLNTGGTANPCGICGTGTTFGWSFRVINAVSINQLGLWDAGANGLGVASADVGLWDANGSLLASATVTDASHQVASASTDGEWLFEDINDLMLLPGSYVIGSVFRNAAPLAQVFSPYVTVADIALTGGAQGNLSAGLSFPGQSFTDPIFGPTMRQAAGVPEPTGLALASLGLVLMVTRRRQTAAAATA